MAVFPPSIDKLSAFRQRNIIKYLQSVHRAGPSSNVYSYNFEYIDKFIAFLDELIFDTENFQVKIWEAYECLFREITMCDNYVKLSLARYQADINASNFDINKYIEYSISYLYQDFLNYREALWDQAELLIAYVNITSCLQANGVAVNIDTIDENVKNGILQINSDVYQITTTMRPEYYMDISIQSDMVQAHTPYNVNIDDIAAIWFDNFADYKYILERCKNTETCDRLSQSNIKRVKDLHHTFYAVGIQVIHDLLQVNNVETVNILTRKISSLLFLDIKLRDCQSKQPALLSAKTDNVTLEGFEGHLQWRQTIWNDAVVLYDISFIDNITRSPYISQLFNNVLSNVNNRHRDQKIHDSLSKMSPTDLITALTRFIPD